MSWLQNIQAKRAEEAAQAEARKQEAYRKVMQEQVLTANTQVRVEVEMAHLRDVRDQAMGLISGPQRDTRPEAVFETLGLPARVPEPREVTLYRYQAEEEARALSIHMPRDLRSGTEAAGFWNAVAHRCAVRNYVGWAPLELEIHRLYYRKRKQFQKGSPIPLPGYPPFPTAKIDYVDGRQLDFDLNVLMINCGLIGPSRYEQQAFARLAHVYFASKGYALPLREDILDRVKCLGNKESLRYTAPFRTAGTVEETDFVASLRTGRQWYDHYSA